MRRRVEMCAVLALLMAVCAGCTTTDTTSSATPAVFYDVLPDESVAESELVSGDSVELSVEVDGNMEVAMHRARVDARGVVTLPLVGEVRVAGMKLEDARKAIFARYGDYYVNPPVIMLATIDENEVHEWGQVTVLGRVNRPGIVPLPSSRGINLSAAIQEAGGFASSAKSTDIRISRTSKTGKKNRVSVNFDEIGLLGKAEADLKLIDGDIVYVPERIF